MCRDVTVEEVAAMIKSADKVLILSHQKPDGDTLGSGFALLYALQGMGKTVRIECSDGFPPRYRFLYPDFDPSVQPQFEPELIVAVDIADTQLLGGSTDEYKERIDLCIDHHRSNSRYAKHLLLDTIAAGTVEIIYAVLNVMGVEIDRKIATCLYTGLSTDTGCFRYSNVTSASHMLAATLIDKGIDSYSINKLMFETKSVACMELERMVMDTLEYYYDNRFAIIVISDEAVQKTGLPEEEMEGIATIPRQIEGVEASMTLKQKGGDIYRISMRSNERIDSSRVCARLGGGGHARAAGCTLVGTLDEVKAKILAEMKDEF
ncbi:DHH family phosphoesterase [Oscillospiraceae bacterium PP1C4]